MNSVTIFRFFLFLLLSIRKYFCCVHSFVTAIRSHFYNVQLQVIFWFALYPVISFVLLSSYLFAGKIYHSLSVKEVLIKTSFFAKQKNYFSALPAELRNIASGFESLFSDTSLLNKE